jgi:hypothetical protein
MGNMAAGQELISRHQDAQVGNNTLDLMFRPGSGTWLYGTVLDYLYVVISVFKSGSA